MTKAESKVVEWLLEPENPAVRHATLVTLLGRSPRGREVKDALAETMRSPPVSTILSRQDAGGWWDIAAGFYHRKYRGTVWQVIFLAQLGADGSDERIRRACEFLFERSQNRDTGGFALSSNRTHTGGSEGCLPCLTGNLVRAMRLLGYGQDERWRRAVDWLVATQHPEGGWSHGPPSQHGCFQGSIKPLLALTDISPAQRTRAVQKAIDRAAEFFLQHRLFRRDHHGFDVAKPAHLLLRFPLGWQTDVLEMLDGVTAAGIVDDPRLGDALAVVLSKRDAAGRWPLDITFRPSGTSSMWCRIETQGKPSKWITLRALRVLNRIGEERAARLAVNSVG